MAKVAKEALYLVSSEGTGYFYTLRVNKKKRKGEGKLSMQKYDPIARKHVLFEEKKLSRLKRKYDSSKANASESQAAAE
ncbi:MAG: 50S ribosomal protein L33 [Bdellovibrionales bacterium]|nr:50S ribosomal protein L33 [Bdellovibrionales bacterium]